ncbi:MAG: ABC transporter permease [Burkholderiaceae bacterium]
MKMFAAVFVKELRDSLRDRRTIMTVLATSVLMGPLALIVLAQFIAGLEAKAEKKEIYVQGVQYAPQLENFLLRQGMNIKAPPENLENALRTGSFQQAVIRVPSDFAKKLAQGERPTLEVLYEGTRTDGAPSVSVANELVRGFTRELGGQRLVAAGIPPVAAQPVDVQRIDFASNQARGAQILFIIPLMLLVGAAANALSVTIDVTAGERERGSLEPLLTTPANRWSVALGKWGIITFYACAVIVLTLAGFWVATQLIRSESLQSLLQFGLPEVTTFLIVLVPFAGFIAAFQMLVASFGRTFKEAQTYATYVLLIVNLIPLMSLFINQKDQLWQLFVPAMAQQFVMERALRGEALNVIDYVIPGVIALAGSMLFVWLQHKLLSREAIVFGKS